MPLMVGHTLAIDIYNDICGILRSKNRILRRSISSYRFGKSKCLNMMVSPHKMSFCNYSRVPKKHKYCETGLVSACSTESNSILLFHWERYLSLHLPNAVPQLSSPRDAS